MTVYTRVLAETYLCDGETCDYVMGYYRGKLPYKNTMFADGDQFYGAYIEVLDLSYDDFKKLQHRNPAGDMAYAVEDVLSSDWEDEE